MMRTLPAAVLAAALALMPAISASAESRVPKGATAKCSDGTYSTAKNKQGACSAHGGVETWLDKEAPKAEAPKAPAPPTRTTREPRETPPPRESKAPAAPAAPAKAGDPTAQCNDGSYSYAAHHQGACSGHQGVKTWFK